MVAVSVSPSTAIVRVFGVDRRRSAPSRAVDRDAEARISPRSPSSATTSPTVSAVVHTVVGTPSISTVTSRPWRTTIVSESRTTASSGGTTRSPGLTVTPWSASACPTVRPKTCAWTVRPSTSNVTVLPSTPKAAIVPTSKASTIAWAPNRSAGAADTAGAAGRRNLTRDPFDGDRAWRAGAHPWGR